MVDTKNNQIDVAGLQLNVNKKRTEVTPKIVLNVNGKPLYLKPSDQLIGELKPFTDLEIQRHNEFIAKKASPVRIQDLNGNYIKVKFKFKNGNPQLYNTETNKYIDNGATILAIAQEKVLKSHSTFYAAESPYDSVQSEKNPKVGKGGE
jgi:hypothetical protein